MKITGIELKNVKGYKRLDKINFSSKINILVGPNNAGKSVILNSIYLLQNKNALNKTDITIGQSNGKVGLYFNGTHKNIITSNPRYEKFEFILETGQRIMVDRSNNGTGLQNIPPQEPLNLIYPYLSKRKSVSFDNTINEQNANSVIGNFTNLYSKIDRLATPQFQPGNSEYIKACNDILGFEISTIAKGNGKQAVLYIHNLEHIPLTAMGEGVTNIIGLIADLCVSEDKIFIIEEPENDIHPKALKALLKLIINKAESNQFFISTHSNIVMKHLGSVSEAKVFQITNNESDVSREKMKLSSMHEISPDPIERKRVLEDLGYDFFDYDLYKAWLFLEESSAEVIVRDFLIRWFFPNLKFQLRTFSAGSTSRIIPKFDDFNKLFVFLHLEPSYKNRVWVYIDSGENEEKIISKMREIYSKSGWNDSNFNQFTEHDFERYYPERFQKEVDDILDIQDKQEKRKGKKELLDRVKVWINENDKLAKEEFKESAKEIISILKQINKELNR